MKKTVIYMVFVFSFIVFLVGCEQAEKIPTSTVTPAQKSPMKVFTIYSIDSDTMSLMPVSVKKEEKEISVSYIVSLVENNIDDDIQIDSVKLDGNTAIVSFDSNGKPIRNCNKKMENMILECFANSLLDNVDGCKKIIFRCDNKEYKSENNSFGLNEVYASE